jgi:hypothetical protein
LLSNFSSMLGRIVVLGNDSMIDFIYLNLETFK